MDPEFQKVLLRVLLVGGVIGILSAGALVIAFRSFGERESGGGPGRKPFIILVAAIVFILLACLVLVVFSLPTRS